MNKHPANNGKVMLSIWVDAQLRDYVRARAMEAKQPVSEWAGNALRQAVLFPARPVSTPEKRRA
jgi:hypothetical protein